ncbi:MAG TPA: MFS transporter [Thermomonospora sp.]|nr:MFS transporter [Thermomonospora sp.]
MVTTTARERAGAREWAGLGVLALPTALLGLDVTLLYLALPELTADLRPSATQVLWIMDAYGFLIAGFLITMGTLGDRIGRRRLLMIGAAAFGAVSVAAAYATSAEMLIAARAALGVAGATLMPSTLALISTMFADARQRTLAIGVWAMAFALGMAAGPVVGGVLLEHFWWGSAFLIAVPVTGLLLVLAPPLLPEYRAPRGGPLDLPSVALSLAAILPVIYAVKEGAETTSALVAAAGVGFGVLFVRRQLRLPSPLLDVRLFAVRAFSAALGVLLAGLVGVGGVMLLVTQYLQLVEGRSPLAAGAWMGPPALMMFVAAIGGPLLARRIRPGHVVAGTLGLSTVGYLLLTQVGTASDTGLVVVGFGLVYFGLGGIAALGTDLVVGAAPPSRAGSASAVSETVQELGVAVGVATLGSLATAVYRSRIGEALPSGLPEATRHSVEDGLPGASSVASSLPGGVLDEAKEAFVAGLHAAALVGAVGVGLLTLLAVFTLRHVGTTGDD